MTSPTARHLNVEMFGDILCPWCYIGKRRLERALARTANPDAITLQWRSYELGQTNQVPAETAADQLAAMWGERAQERLNLIRDLGEEEGLELNLNLARPVSTFDAHRLVHLAADRARQTEMLERLLQAYHTEALNIADHRTLAALARDAGIDGADALAVLGGDRYADRVAADRHAATSHGITGVPSLVIGGRSAGTAIQPSDALDRLLRTEEEE